MARTIFVAPIGDRVGKTTFCLGLVFCLKNIAPRVGFMKPVGQRNYDEKGMCEDTRLLAKTFGLETDGRNICPMNTEGLEKRLLAGHQKQVLDDIAVAHESISKNRDVVVLEGMDLTSVGGVQTDLNVSLASRLNAQVLLLVSGAPAKPFDELIYETVHARNIFAAAGCRVLGVVINMAPADNMADFEKRVRAEFQARRIDVMGIIPELPILGAASMRDIITATESTILVEGDLRKLAQATIVGAMRPAKLLARLGPNTLVITSGDRDDIIMSLMAADLLDEVPSSVAGLILTGGIAPDEEVLSLLKKSSKRDFVVALTKNDTFKTAATVNEMNIPIHENDAEKIEASEQAVETYCDCIGLFKAAGAAVTREKKPQDYLDELIRAAKRELKHIVLSEGSDERVLQAAAHIQKREIARVTLLGDVDIISENAKKLNISLHKLSIIDPAKADVEDYAKKLHEIRKEKGLGIHAARDLVRDEVYYSAMMVQVGDADGYVSGAIHSTADTLRPALQIIGTAPGLKFVSSVFLMLRGPKAFFYGDCAIIENPDKEQLATIAVGSARTAQSFGIEPIVAMLSYSTGSSGKGSSVQKVREAAILANEMAPDILLEGPIQYDAAFDEKVARVKMPDSKVAGRANVFIFPDLNSGNIAYKAVQREAGAMAIGPICQGFRKPVNDLSRGCTAEDIVYLTAITAIQAQRMDA